MKSQHRNLVNEIFSGAIDPLVRRLTLLHNLGGHENFVSRQQSRKKQEVNLPLELERLKRQKYLLILLRSALENALHAVHKVELSDDDITSPDEGSTVSKLRGVAVPVLAILRESTDLQLEHSKEPKHSLISPSLSGGSSVACNIDDGLVNSENENSHHNQRMIFILRSANYSCMEEAALVLAALWRFTNRFYQNSDVFHRRRLNTKCESPINENTSEFQSSEPGICPVIGEPKSTKMEMNETLILPSLTSCAMALSSLKIVEENDRFSDGGMRKKAGDFDSNHGECEKQIKQSSVEEGELDRGEECAIAILSCIQSVFEPRNPVEDEFTKIAPHLDGVACVINEVKERETSTFAQEVGTAMGGALVARLVQGCLSLLSQDAESMKTGVENNSRKKSAKLQLEALKTMRLFLEAIPMVDLWRSILPGCFAVSILHKNLMHPNSRC